jgi:hypothetical protein
VNDLIEYMELIVEPTWEEYNRNSADVRHAYLACLVVYHAVDRAAYPKKPDAMAKRWARESLPFMLVAEVALHFKHGTRHWVKTAKKQNPNALLITRPLGLQGALKDLETRHLWFQVRDALTFVREKAKLPAAKR